MACNKNTNGFAFPDIKHPNKYIKKFRSCGQCFSFLIDNGGKKPCTKCQDIVNQLHYVKLNLKESQHIMLSNDGKTYYNPCDLLLDIVLNRLVHIKTEYLTEQGNRLSIIWETVWEMINKEYIF